MRITLLTYGSRGDVQPFLALAVGLQKAGHQISLAAPLRFEAFVTEYGIRFVPLAGDPALISQRLNDAGSNPARMVTAISKYVFEIAPRVAWQAFSACKTADLIVHSFLFTAGGNAMARKLGIPDVSIQTFPFFAPTGDLPMLSAPNLSSPILRKFLHWLAIQIYWQGSKFGYRRLRRTHPEMPDLDLRWPFSSALPPESTPLVFAISPTVVSRPRDWPEAYIHIPGYFFLDTAKTYRPPDELAKFLAEGEPPICVSFGSTIHRRSAEIYNILLHSIQKTHNRAIILSGWESSQPPPSAEHIFTAKAIPHDWLLPRCKMVIHHGGAGTTAAGLRAGIPNLVIPFASDQPFWGQRVQAIGAGPAPIPINKLSETMLASAILKSEEPSLRQASGLIGKAIRSENGIDQTIKIIESLG